MSKAKKQKRKMADREAPPESLSIEEVKDLAEIAVRADNAERRAAALLFLLDEIQNGDRERCDVLLDAAQGAFAACDFADQARFRVVARMRSLRQRQADGVETAGDAVWAFMRNHDAQVLEGAEQCP